MNDDDLRSTYAATRRSQPSASDRPSLEELQQLVEGDVPANDREALLDRILADPATTRELAMLQAVSAGRPRARPWMLTRWAPLVAAAAVVLVVTPLVIRSRDTAPVYRAGDNGESAIRIVSPADGASLSAGTQLTWHPVGDADRYVVEIVSSAGDAIARVATNDTTLVLPDSIAAARVARAAGWMVVAHLRDGGQRQSAMRVIAARTP